MSAELKRYSKYFLSLGQQLHTPTVNIVRSTTSLSWGNRQSAKIALRCIHSLVRMASPNSSQRHAWLYSTWFDIHCLAWWHPLLLVSITGSMDCPTTGRADHLATIKSHHIDNRGEEHSTFKLYVLTHPEFERLWCFCQTFSAAPHYSLGPAKSLWLPPLPVHMTHHQVVIDRQFQPSFHLSVQAMQQDTPRIGRPDEGLVFCAATRPIGSNNCQGPTP